MAVHGNLGVLPRFSPGLGLGAATYLDAQSSLLLGGELSAYAPIRQEAEGEDDMGGRFWLFAATGTFCRQLVRAEAWPPYFAVCALGELYGLVGAGYGGDRPPKTGIGLWFAPGAAVELGFTRRPAQIGLRVGGLVSIRPPKYVMDNVGKPVHEPGVWVGTVALVARWSIL
jgi:hypothetical protein